MRRWVMEQLENWKKNMWRKNDQRCAGIKWRVLWLCPAGKQACSAVWRGPGWSDGRCLPSQHAGAVGSLSRPSSPHSRSCGCCCSSRYWTVCWPGFQGTANRFLWISPCRTPKHQSELWGDKASPSLRPSDNKTCMNIIFIPSSLSLKQ